MSGHPPLIPTPTFPLQCMGPLKECRAEMDAALPKTGPIADLFFEMNQTSAITAAATSYLDVRPCLLGLPAPPAAQQQASLL